MDGKITVSAKTLDEAITKALIELQTTSEHLQYEVVQRESSGLFGLFGGKSCIIRARVMSEEEERALEAARREEEKKKAAKEKAEKEAAARAEAERAAKAAEEKAAAARAAEEKAARAAEEKAARAAEEKAARAAEEKAARAAGEKAAKAAAEKMSGAAGEKAVRAAEEKTARVPAEKPAKPAPKVDEEAVKKAAKEFLEQVFGAMGMEVSIESVYNPGERELQVMMNGGDMGILIGKRGQTLDSLQYLVSLVVNKETEGYLRVKLDTENYRERRRETLETLAKNIAYKVKRTKHPVSLEPMNPYERRIIHSALQNDRYVVTRSEGEDPYRHVVISLKRDSGGNGRRERYGSSRKDKGRADRSEEKQPEVLAEAASDTEA